MEISNCGCLDAVDVRASESLTMDSASVAKDVLLRHLSVHLRLFFSRMKVLVDVFFVIITIFQLVARSE